MANISKLGDQAITQIWQEKPIVLLPIGAVESHGDHLPAGTDNYLSTALAKRLEEKLEAVPNGKKALRLPNLPYGQVWSLGDAVGSIGISNQVVTDLIVQISQNVAKRGACAVAVINAHWGNHSAIKDAQRALIKDEIDCLNFFYPETKPLIEEIRETRNAKAGYMHADEIETALMLELAPEHVNMENAIVNYPNFPLDFDTRAYLWSAFSQSPILGDPTKATKQKGLAIVDQAINVMIKHLARYQEHYGEDFG